MKIKKLFCENDRAVPVSGIWTTRAEWRKMIRRNWRPKTAARLIRSAQYYKYDSSFCGFYWFTVFGKKRKKTDKTTYLLIPYKK